MFFYHLHYATKASLRAADGLKKRYENHVLKFFPIAWEKHWYCLGERQNL